ncbi:MAG: hypothetical protein AB7P49_09550 [Bdellovibrionales bacterium]
MRSPGFDIGVVWEALFEKSFGCEKFWPLHADVDTVLSLPARDPGYTHLNRLNAAKALAQVVKFIHEFTGAPVYIKSARAGEEGVFNKIPSLLSAELYIEKEFATPALKTEVQAFLNALARKNPEDAKRSKIKILLEKPKGSENLAFGDSFTRALVEGILQAPNGIVHTSPKYEHSILTSSNLSFLNPGVDQTNTSIFNLGYFARGFEWSRMESTAASINLGFSFSDVLPRSKIEVEDKGHYDAWLEPESSSLLQTVLSIDAFSKKYYLNGGLEPSAFREKIKGLEVVALEPLIRHAHSVEEKMKKDSIEPVVRGVRAILERL